MTFATFATEILHFSTEKTEGNLTETELFVYLQPTHSIQTMKHRLLIVYALLSALFLFSALPTWADKQHAASANEPKPHRVQDTKLYFADHVFSAPGRSFMQRIKTIPADAPIVVTGLPQGLVWNPRLRVVQGRVSTSGTYHYNINLMLSERTDSALVPHPVTLTVDNRYSESRPVMGWISWNVVEGDISDKVVRATADQMEKLGLKEAGYDHLIIDDLWHAPTRNADKTPKEDPTKFPNGMKAVVDYVHDKGLKFGIYSDAAEKTCAGAFGSFKYEDIDASHYARWGVDLLKYDYCHAPKDVTEASFRYRTMGDALRSSGRNIALYICEWGVREPWKWGAETGASTWRCTYDTRDCWNGKPGGIGVLQSIEQMKDLWPYGGIHRYNDADMMCVGIHGKGKSSSDLCATGPGMTQDEYRTQFALWCMWSSPLLLSFDLNQPLSADDLSLITNKDLIAINQDEMAQPAEFLGQEGDLYYFQKPLSNGDVAIAVTNVGEKDHDFLLEFSRFPLAKGVRTFKIRDCQLGSDMGAGKGGFKATVRRHATLVYRLSENVEMGNIVRKNLKQTLAPEESTSSITTQSIPRKK